QESLIGAYEKPPAMPEDTYCLKFRDVTTVRFRNTPLHFASLLCVFRLVVADASRHNQGPRGIDR
ncbi:hypothetical protein, partial [Pluralibacter gergoviae]|uniref:hypothetical protein n=1 Tax=Pluralibacter gergoviae TaxID=61647 RepID=UPI001E5A274B